MNKVKFSNISEAQFLPTLRNKVENYFKENHKPKSGGNTIMIKAIILISTFFVAYGLIMLGHFPNYINLILTIVMGLGTAGIGMGVMHDAVHGSFSKKKWVNKLFGSTLYWLGGNVYNWEIQHNSLHHTYTNILHLDEDITGKFMLRLNQADRLRIYHRVQYVYAFLLYSMMTISFLWKDFKEIPFFNSLAKTGIVKPFTTKQLVILFITKILYVIFIFVIPMYFLDITLGQWFAGFMAMHLTAGLILATVFQLAHVVEGADQPIPDSHDHIESAWAVHQLKTTSNFFSNNLLLSWYIGGLDFQIEHHLFPKISHVHYRKISKIVKETAEEFGFVYNSKGSFINALNSHIQMLKKLGKYETI
ncbi:MAG: acyl-CoA desaturase [Cytophagaceae bacterium]|nr:acyl-CoA desaturase [Cytophagaceae bacterium]MBL0303064.1 acyl-CoA desaturase [Cytophagaceae bacterium]MBL0325908.1 acyl-CoA desaturase [Cytophagaceae bacterium]